MLDNHSDIYLLQVYLKTFYASKVIFPGVPPRKWGEEFTLAEQKVIYQSLISIITLATPWTDSLLVEEFKRVPGPGKYMHWFVSSFSEQIVDLLTAYALERARVNRWE